MLVSEVVMAQTFLYFAYGSNLLAKRIHINSPSAVRYGIGKLEDYSLDFSYYSKRWKGAAATIVPNPGKSVWGAIWQIDINELPKLDIQEGVHDNIYFRFETDIKLPNSNITRCHVYQQTKNPQPFSLPNELPVDRLPSKIYLHTIKTGAKESELPQKYRDFLAKIPDNNYDGDVELKLDLSETGKDDKLNNECKK